MAIFGLGIVVCVAGGLKTQYIIESMGHSYDEQWDAYSLWIVTTVEIDVGIICASAPALRPFVVRYLPKVFGSSRGRSNNSATNGSRPYRPRSILFSPTLRSPSIDSQGDDHNGDAGNYISLSGSPKLAPRSRMYSNSSLMDGAVVVDTDYQTTGRTSSQREFIKKPPRTSKSSSAQSPTHSDQPFDFSDAFHNTATATTVTARGPPETEQNNNFPLLHTVRARIEEELERQGKVGVRRSERGPGRPEWDVEQNGGQRGQGIDYEEE